MGRSLYNFVNVRASGHLEHHAASDRESRIGRAQAIELVAMRRNLITLEAEARGIGHSRQRLHQIALSILFQIRAAFQIGLRGQTRNRAGIAVGVIQKQWSFPLLRMTKCTGSY